MYHNLTRPNTEASEGRQRERALNGPSLHQDVMCGDDRSPYTQEINKQNWGASRFLPNSRSAGQKAELRSRYEVMLRTLPLPLSLQFVAECLWVAKADQLPSINTVVYLQVLCFLVVIFMQGGLCLVSKHFLRALPCPRAPLSSQCLQNSSRV